VYIREGLDPANVGKCSVGHNKYTTGGRVSCNAIVYKIDLEGTDLRLKIYGAGVN
jgi:hypothetical protein